MITVLLFTGLCLGLVCLVVTDCQAHHHTPGAKEPPKDSSSRD